MIRKLLGGLLVLLLAPTLAVAAPSPGPADPKLVQRVRANEEFGQGPVTLSKGHVDLGARIINGKWQLAARDDTAGKPVWRSLDDIVFQVTDKAKQQVPDTDQFNFLPRGKEIYAIGQQEIPSVVWLGWNTQSPEVIEALGVGATLTFLGHQGPGDFALFLQAGNFGAAQPLWLSAKPEKQDIFVEPNVHTHANWVFTQPGIHLVKVGISAQLKDGQTVSSEKILRFAVSETTSVDSARSATWSAKPNSDTKPTAGVGFEWFIGAGAIGVLLLAVAGAAIVRKSRTEKLSAEEEVTGAGLVDN